MPVVLELAGVWAPDPSADTFEGCSGRDEFLTEIGDFPILTVL